MELVSNQNAVRYGFGRFELQPDERRLLASGTPVVIKPRAFDVLVALVERHGRLVTKEHLLAQVWPGVIVEENAVHTQISTLRKVLGADAIATVSGAGYRFALEVVENRAESGSESTTPARHNLVRQLTSFIGREQQLAELKELLNRTRLLTLTGAGGCGKSRLAMELGVQVSDAYADGVWLVELAALADPELVPQTVAGVLGLKERAGKSFTDMLLGHLASRHLLLVLDNAEHLLAACAELVRSLVQRCARLTVLVTSREHLGVLGELTYRVPSLSVPDSDQKLVADPLVAHESVRLFIDRARLQQPYFTVTAQSASAIASICAHLDGIPLAIELAAARVRALSAEEVSQRLDERFRLLTDSRTALPRHRTLRALIDWSYDLLSDGERALFHRVGVFAGGWTLASAEQVCAGDGIEAPDVLERLTSLVDKSLVMADEQAGTTRYRMLETVRQYTLDRLRERGEEARWRRAHLDCFVALTNEFHGEGIEGPRQQWWFSRMASEHDNLRAALAFATRSSPLEGLELAIKLHGFFMVRGHLTEGRQWYARLLGDFPVDGPKRVRARGLHAEAWLAADQGDRGLAKRLLRESLALFREIGDTTTSPQRARYTLAHHAIQDGDYSEGEDLSREAVDAARAMGQGQRTLLCASLDNLGRALHAQGRWDAARECYEEALEVARELGTAFEIGLALNSLGAAEGDERHSEAALKHLAEGLRILHGIGYRVAIIESLEGMAGVFATMSAPRRAARLWGASDALRQEIGSVRSAHESSVHERRLEPVRAILTAEEFARAWEEGRKMSLDDAVRYALDDEAGSEPGRGVSEST
jgi:non-specific serine/threonine protein kinase